MQAIRICVLATLLFALVGHSPVLANGEQPFHNDAFTPPPPAQARRGVSGKPDRYMPSAFLSGNVSVRLLFLESDGSTEPSTENWTTPRQAEIATRAQEALDWWAARMPNAMLKFNLVSQVVNVGYEPILHNLNDEKLWASEAFQKLGFGGANHFEQAYSADEALRQETKSDWATTIFVIDSQNDTDGRFSDGYFAYAYVNGPFMVITSDAGAYTTTRLSPVIAHELGHIFGALDQYETAGTPCTLESGYLSVATTNSQANNCGTKNPSIMWEPLSTYANGSVDSSALAQVGYRDTNNNKLPDPLDTKPTLNIQLTQSGSSRPLLVANASDTPWPSPIQTSVSINTISSIEYRIDGGEWSPLPSLDGAYDSINESVAGAIPMYDGTHKLEVRARNRVGNSSLIGSSQVTVSGVGSEPAIDLGLSEFQNQIDIQFNISAPINAQYRVGSTPALDALPWKQVDLNAGYTLADTDGKQSMYVQFRVAGLETPIYQYNVTLDRLPPTGQAMPLSPNSPGITITGSDSGSGIEAMKLTYKDGGESEWMPFSAQVAPPTGEQIIALRLRDNAGNVSEELVVGATSYAVYTPLLLW